MCSLKRYGFSAILVINMVSIIANFGHFGHKQGMALHSSLDIFKKISHSFVIVKKKINKHPSQILFTVI